MNQLSIRRLMNCGRIGLIAAAALHAPAWAWPDRTVQIVVGFPAGGAVDGLARALAETMTRSLGQSVVVVNRDGGGGTLATAAVAKAMPDGYTLGFSTVGPLTLQPHLKSNLPYKLNDLVGICQTFVNDVALVASPLGNFKSVADVVAEARKNPGRVDYGIGGLGTFPHMAAVQFGLKADVKLQAIPYKGAPPVMNALRSGEVPLGTLPPGLAHSQGLQMLAVFAPSRLPVAPDVPTMTELGYPVVAQLFGGLYGPKDMPAPVRATLQSACQQAVKSENYVAASTATQQDVAYTDGATFTKDLQQEWKVQRELIKAAGLKLE